MTQFRSRPDEPRKEEPKKEEPKVEVKPITAGVTAKPEAKKPEPKKEEKKEEHEKSEGHPRLAKQLLDLIERIEERKTPFTDDEQRIMQTAVKRLSRTMGDYRAPE